MTPIPPARAIPIAMSDSVTVSIAADENGTLSGIPRVNSEVVLTSFGWINECRGVRRTSSKVRTTSELTSVRGKPLEQSVECSDVASPFIGLGAESFDWSLRSVRPWHHIDHQPAYRGKAHRPGSAPRRELAECDAHLIGEMADHSLRRQSAPTSLTLRSQSVDPPLESQPCRGVEHRGHDLSQAKVRAANQQITPSCLLTAKW